ncbi:hypothetical protein [Methanolobus psychrotolerans]|nr:hypothetical protein [Methanolobus psychrotolerans]
MDDYDPMKVYFRCNVCDFLFMENPERFPVMCPQCGSEDVFRT